MLQDSDTLGPLCLQDQHLREIDFSVQAIRELLDHRLELLAPAAHILAGDLDQAGQHAHRLGIAKLLTQPVERRLRPVQVAGRESRRHQGLTRLGLRRLNVQRPLERLGRTERVTKLHPAGRQAGEGRRVLGREFDGLLKHVRCILRLTSDLIGLPEQFQRVLVVHPLRDRALQDLDGTGRTLGPDFDPG